MYARHYRTGENPETAPKLYVTKLETGSIIAEIAPLVATFGYPVYHTMVAANAVSGFTKRLNDGIKAFAGIDGGAKTALPDENDAADLREFLRPLTGRKQASLAIKHARYRKTDGEKEIVVEYDFDEAVLNRAAVNIEKALESPNLESAIEIESPPSSAVKSEVMLIFDKASRAPGKEKGRASNWTIVSEVSEKALPTYFRKSVRGNLKDLMVRGEANPLTDIGFIVDVHVEYKDGEARAYVVTDFHDTVDLGG